MLTPANSHTATWLALTKGISRSRSVEEICSAALDAVESGAGVDRSSIQLLDPDGVVRFKAWRGLSDSCRAALEAHTLCPPDLSDPQPLVVPDVTNEPAVTSLIPALEAEGIAAITCIPLMGFERVIGTLTLCSARTGALDVDAHQFASVIAAQVAFAVDRTRAEAQARRSEERLRFALEAAEMGTWDWDLATNAVQWSDNLERIHGLPPGTFDGTFASYEREIHPDDRPRVLASVQRALAEGVPHEVEYRIVAPDGTVRWCEGKGRVEYQEGVPVRMTGVCMMVTRRKEAELEKLSAAEESSRLKDEFLATLSHELRTPLNAILGWAQMLLGGELTPARAEKAIQVIGRNATLQGQLIEDILDVSRIITGKLNIERAPVSIPQLLESAVGGVAPGAQAKGVTIELRASAVLPGVEGDAKRLTQVLNNVLSNAVKFTPEGGSIAVECASTDGWLTIRVRDSGVGIAREFLPFIFDRFRQADSRSTRSHGGLGLGLAITRHLVEQHGGTIEAQSDGRGCGTTVTIHLPADAGQPAGVVPPPASEPDVRLDGAWILVVDDEPDSREMLATLLEQRGATVSQCDNAESALQMMASHSVQLLIADIAMPAVDGYELMRRLRAAGNATPAIAVTAFARSDDRRRALACGYNAYCAKPIDASELARTVRDLGLTS